MSRQQFQWLSSDSQETISLIELSHCCGLTTEELDELVQYRALLPAGNPGTGYSFSVQWIAPLRRAAKLRLDFDLDTISVALLLERLIQIEALQRQLQSLQALLPVPPAQRPG